MSRIEVAIMDLEPREQFTLLGGTKQDRARALFIGLLPPGDACYTASEVVKRSLPGKEVQDLYLSHYRALDSLARVHGIGDGKNPGPDNIDPQSGKRLPGKKPGTLQPCRWNRKSWLAIVSDEMYDWLIEFNKKIVELVQNQPAGTRYWCDLETFEITAEIPAGPLPTKVSGKISPPRGRRIWCDGRLIAGLSGLAAAIFLTVILWPNPKAIQESAPVPNHPDETPSEAELVLDYREYIKANRSVASNLLTPNPSLDRVANWKPDPPQAMLATNPPPSFLAGGESIF